MVVITSEVANVFMYLLTIPIFSLVKCLLIFA